MTGRIAPETESKQKMDDALRRLTCHGQDVRVDSFSIKRKSLHLSSKVPLQPGGAGGKDGTEVVASSSLSIPRSTNSTWFLIKGGGRLSAWLGLCTASVHVHEHPEHDDTIQQRSRGCCVQPDTNSMPAAPIT